MGKYVTGNNKVPQMAKLHNLRCIIIKLYFILPVKHMGTLHVVWSHITVQLEPKNKNDKNNNKYKTHM